MKKILVTFAGCSYPLKLSQNRLTEQAKQHFDGCANYDECNDFVLDLLIKHKSVSQYRRGVGFWFWKPFIIYKTLESLNDGDFAFYVDSGTDIVGDVSPMFDLCAQNDGFLLFENKDGNPNNEVWQNYMWTKKDCFALMNCDEEKYHYGQQVDAAYQLYQKNSKTMNFLKEYCDYSTDSRIISDEPNTLGANFPEYKDHRHDQSIVSLLATKYNIKLFPEPSEVGHNNRPANTSYSTVFYHHRAVMFGRK